MFARALGISALLAGTSAAAPLGPAPVIGGKPATHDRAVVALTTHGGTVYCSGTLVSPRVVVTAAHCIYQITAPVYVFFGTDPADDGVFVPVDTAIPYPGYNHRSPADIGLVILSRPVPIEPVRLPERDLANPELAGSIRLIGFGDSQPADDYAPSGVKLAREVDLVNVEPYFLHYGVGACHGDSGGTTLARDPDGTDRLVGVISRGDADCVAGGYSTRVDLYRDWIQTWIAKFDAASCALDGRCANDCDAPDPDCAMPGPEPTDEPTTGGCSAGGGGPGVAMLLLGLVLVRRRRP